MDIVLNTTFNNPKLPVVPLPGFVDSFSRPNGPLGSTDDGKAWEIFGSGPSWEVAFSRGGVTAGSGSSFGLAAADALTADGTLTAQLASLEPGDLRTGLAVRVLDESNYVSILLGAGTTSAGMRIQSRIGGSATTDATTATAANPGDVVSVTTSGPVITVYVNDVQRLTANIPALTTVTRHGFYSYSAARVLWEDIQFTAA